MMESREEATRGTHAGMIMCKHVTKLSFFFSLSLVYVMNEEMITLPG